MVRRCPALLAAAALLVAAPAADAVLIASGDGTGNVTAPPDDPGFANVGILNGLCAVYLGNGWVLTAYHVGDGTVTFGGVDHPFVPGSRTRLSGPNPAAPDLAVMKIAGDPGLPTPTIADSPPPIGAEVVLIGRGKTRGAALSWMGIDGWNWDFPFTMRWGTNRISATGVDLLDTRSLEMAFDALGLPGATPHEAHTVLGDSGGATFWKDGGTWKLAGTLFLSLNFQDQPAQTSLIGNVSVAADLSYYRSQIQAIVQTPACSDGLDDDLDGLVDHPADPGCDGPGDTSERSPSLECDDGLDNDGDGQIDHPADPECVAPTTPSEAPTVPMGAGWSIFGLASGLVGLGVRRAVGTGVRGQSSRRTR